MEAYKKNHIIGICKGLKVLAFQLKHTGLLEANSFIAGLDDIERLTKELNTTQQPDF